MPASYYSTVIFCIFRFRIPLIRSAHTKARIDLRSAERRAFLEDSALLCLRYLRYRLFATLSYPMFNPYIKNQTNKLCCYNNLLRSSSWYNPILTLILFILCLTGIILYNDRIYSGTKLFFSRHLQFKIEIRCSLVQGVYLTLCYTDTRTENANGDAPTVFALIA
jgi:hypothetical protein